MLAGTGAATLGSLAGCVGGSGVEPDGNASNGTSTADALDLREANVVVRGHDETHGYGEQALVVNLDTGGVRAVRQGREPQSVADLDCAAVTATATTAADG